MSKKTKDEKQTSISAEVDIEKLITIAMATPLKDDGSVWGIPTILWGAPGIGKSATIQQVGDSLEVPVRTVFVPGLEPTDVKGAPALDPQHPGRYRLASVLGPANDLMRQGSGILFWDEVSCAPPSVQSTLMSVFLNRRIGDDVLPGEVRLVAAANPADQAASGYDLVAPAANRLLHLPFPAPTTKKWTDWFLGVNDQLPPLKHAEVEVMNKWGEVSAKTKGLFSGFMWKRGAELLNKLPADGDPQRGLAWPSSRTWEAAYRVYTTSKIIGKRLNCDPEDAAMWLVAGCVGDAAATEFFAWAKMADLPDPQEMLINGWEPDAHRLDRTFAALSSMGEFVKTLKGQNGKDKLLVNAWKILNKSCDMGMADISHSPAKSLVDSGFGSLASREIAEASRPVIARLFKSGFLKLAKEGT